MADLDHAPQITTPRPAGRRRRPRWLAAVPGLVVAVLLFGANGWQPAEDGRVFARAIDGLDELRSDELRIVSPASATLPGVV
ncbi:hypothetical protein [Nonomuraea dietziae]|uniref:hypothetical protein n=1 Tax=Nonomuraea dietziae TaxID=65515 RepID=UPI003415DC26